ncbi:pPIWI_RE module domain-containing protein [Alkalihalobacillus sp. R86527]|uniref:pPIWI_RE module domain-containing protein n=1 Tax=Alkalihalobacillus sp. R86527 TaxID=3093863 RepID=UPI00366F8040
MTCIDTKTAGQPYQYYLDKAHLNEQRIVTLSLPGKLQRYLRDTNFRMKQEKRGQYLHLSTLSKMLFHRFGHLFHVETRMYRVCHKKGSEASTPFLYATEPIDTDEIKERIVEWFEQDSSYTFTFEWDSEWEWTQHTIGSFFDCNSGLVYDFLPSYLHDQIAQTPHQIEGVKGGEELLFYHRLQGEEGTSCVSKPFYVETKLRQSEYKEIKGLIERYPSLDVGGGTVKLPASLQIKLRLVTKGGENEAHYINAELSLVRYPYWDLTSKLYDSSFRLMVSSNDESMRNANEALVDVAIEKKQNVFHPKYKKEQRLLDDLRLKGFSMEELIENPMNGVEPVGDFIALPVFNQDMDGKKMYVEAGLGYEERRALFAYVSSFLSMKPVAPLSSEQLQSNRLKYPYDPTTPHAAHIVEIWDTVEQFFVTGLKEHLVGWLGRSVTESVVIIDPAEIHIQNPSFRLNQKGELTNMSYKVLSVHCEKQAFKEDVLATIDAWHDEMVEKGLRESQRHEAYLIFSPGEGETSFQMTLKTVDQERSFSFVYRDVLGLTGPLESYVTKNGKQAPYGAKRVEEMRKVANRYPTTEHPVMALVNMPAHHKHPSTSFYDCKNDVKEGLALANRLPQCMNVDINYDVPNAYYSSFDDVLKHAGFLPKKLFHQKGTSHAILQPDAIWLGFKKITLRKFGKKADEYLVASKLVVGEKPHLCILDDQRWLPMDEFNRRAVSGELFRNVRREHVPSYKLRHFYSSKIEELLHNELAGSNGTIYAIFDAALRKDLVGEMKNSNMTPRNKPFIHDPRIAYIRYNHTNEVPELEVYNRTDERLTRGSGIFFDDKREAVYSVGSKPDTAQLSLSVNKLDRGDKAITRQLARELYVMGEPDPDKRMNIIRNVHRMRNGAITYNKESADVAPLNVIENASSLMRGVK